MVEATWQPSVAGTTNIEVVQVLQNSNHALRERFHADVKSGRWSGAGRVAVLTDGFLQSDEGVQGAQDAVYLFHGARTSAVDAICKQGFAPGPGANPAHSNFRFSEHSSTADQLAVDDREGMYQGLLVMLVCRVMLGRCHESESDAGLQAVSAGMQRGCHSVVQETTAASSRSREFIPFDGAQAHPDFVVLYRRNDAK
jgi:hypothetical protein